MGLLKNDGRMVFFSIECLDDDLIISEVKECDLGNILGCLSSVSI